MRDFNTAGPVRPDKHYCIPPLVEPAQTAREDVGRAMGAMES